MDFDIVHCHFIPPILIAFFTKKPTFVITHESANAYPKIWIRFFKFLMRNTIIINVSKFNRDYWAKILGRKGKVIYHAIDSEKFNPNIRGNEIRDKIKEELKCDYIIICIGALNQDRGADKIVEAISKINTNNTYKLGLVLKTYGKNMADEKKFENLVTKKSIPIKIFSEFLKTKDLAELIKASDIFIRSTKKESFGIAPLEAMALGIPLILTKIQCHLEIFDGPGLFYEFNDVDDLAFKIQYLLKDEEFRKSQIYIGLKKAYYYSWASKVDKYLKIYEIIIGKPDSKRKLLIKII
jgi:glycosyltransferase involved in cell wall biosynthesis